MIGNADRRSVSSKAGTTGEGIGVGLELNLDRNTRLELRWLKIIKFYYKMIEKSFKKFSPEDRETVLLKSCSKNCAHCAIDKLNLLSKTPSVVTDLSFASLCRLMFSKPEVNKVLEMKRGSGKSFPLIDVRTLNYQKTKEFDKLKYFSHVDCTYNGKLRISSEFNVFTVI